MISVMNDFEIDRNPGSPQDLSFFGMESPKEEDVIDWLQIESHDLEEARVRVSSAKENHWRRWSLSRGLEPKSELDDEDPADKHRLTTGDMVWGKVKSHPWWPGHIFNESFASPSVRRIKRDDNVLVAFFGDSSYGWFDPSELIHFEPHFVEKSKQTSLRSFVRAVEESIDEVSRRAALGLACRCQNPNNFRPTKVPNYYSVDVVGYERNGIYSKRQIIKARKFFDAKKVVNFMRKLAVMPRGNETKDVKWHLNMATALAVRTRRYEEYDETYAQAFGQSSSRPAIDELGVPEQAESFAPRGINALMPMLKVHVLYLNSFDCMTLVFVLSLFHRLTCFKLADTFWVLLLVFLASYLT